MHLASFPEDVEALIDDRRSTRGGRGCATMRDEVNRALEAARQEKMIGTSLGARVTLTAGGETGRAARASYEADLPMLFIVSQVALDPTGADGVSVSVSRAEGEKCERCWRVVPDVSRRRRIAGTVQPLHRSAGGRRADGRRG